MKQILQKFLQRSARDVIRQHQPHIIGITGNVGKTTTREVLARYLEHTESDVRSPMKNYNNEWGVPFTILGKAPKPGKPWTWLSVLWTALRMKRKNASYPSVLVLEIGVDAPGDMDTFTQDFLYVDTLILTNIGENPVHKEFFQSTGELAKEKLKLLSILKEDGTLIYNADEPRFKSLPNRTTKIGTVLSFGLNNADFQAKNISQSLTTDTSRWELHGSGLVPYVSFIVVHRGASVPIDIPYMFAKTQVYMVLPVIAYAVSHGTNLVSVSNRLTYAPTPGRLRFLEGMNGSVVIDDTYNAAPQAMHQALDVFESLNTSEARCVAILGDMKELGDDTVSIHKELVEPLMKYADIFVGVGECMKEVSKEIQDEPLIETLSFSTSQEAAEWARHHINDEDIIVVKGAQSMRMERVVKAIMAYPEYAKQVLARQDRGWE